MFRPKIIYTREQLEKAVRTSKSYSQILKKLGHKHPGASEYAGLERDIIKHGINASHLKRRRTARKYTREQLEEAVKKSFSMKRVTEILACSRSQYLILLMDIARWNIDISHFDGREHLKNNKCPLLYKYASLDNIFANKIPITSCALKNRLIREGIKQHRCEICFRTEYLGDPIPIELNHINGNENDNRLENLQIVCPNCHSQTPTFAGRNKMLLFSDQQIVTAVKNNKSMTQALLQLGGKRTLGSGAYFNRLREDINRLDIDTLHWETSTRKQNISRAKSYYDEPIGDVLVKNSKYKTDSVRRRLFKEGIKTARCECCGITEWNGKALSFTLDHKNGIKNDHRIDNIQILCFICHARTRNYKGKNTPIEKRGKAIQYSKRRQNIITDKNEGSGPIRTDGPPFEGR